MREYVVVLRFEVGQPCCNGIPTVAMDCMSGTP